MFTEIYAILIAGFSLGLLHAFDADHVMAVTTLSTQKPSLKRTVMFGAQWAVGHGGVLLLCGLLLFGLSIQLPGTLIALAESSVGILLIVIGAVCFYQCYRQKLKLVEHTHGETKHTHWVVDEADHKTKNEHAPVFVGMLHGLAGSAPALAIVPVLASSQLPEAQSSLAGGQLTIAILYLLIFSVGVLLSMTSFALALGTVQKQLKSFDARVFQASRYLVSLASMVLGAYWLTA